MPQLKMLIFSSDGCPTCKHLENNVLPVFRAAHPDLPIEIFKLAMDPEENPPTTEEEKATEALADAYNVQAFPTILLIGEVARGHGEVCSAPALKKFVQAAQKGKGK